MIADRSTTVWRPVGKRSEISRQRQIVLWLSATTATCRCPIANQSPTTPRPPCVTSKNLDLVAVRFHLQQAKSLWNQIVLATFLWHLQPVGDQSANALRPLRKFPTSARNNGFKAVADRLQAMCDRGFARAMLEGNATDKLLPPRFETVATLVVVSSSWRSDSSTVSTLKSNKKPQRSQDW